MKEFSNRRRQVEIDTDMFINWQGHSIY